MNQEGGCDPRVGGGGKDMHSYIGTAVNTTMQNTY